MELEMAMGEMPDGPIHPASALTPLCDVSCVHVHVARGQMRARGRVRHAESIVVY